jgi:hypothetical protein
MPWVKNGRYYQRTSYVNGRLVTKHIGGGIAGLLATEQDAELKQEREKARKAAARLLGVPGQPLREMGRSAAAQFNGARSSVAVPDQKPTVRNNFVNRR